MLVLKIFLFLLLGLTTVGSEFTRLNEPVISKSLIDINKNGFPKENNSSNTAPSSGIRDLQNVDKQNFTQHLGRERIPLPVFIEGQSIQLKMEETKSKINVSLPDSLNGMLLPTTVPLPLQNLKGDSSVSSKKETFDPVFKNNSKIDELKSTLVNHIITNISVTSNISNSNQDLKLTSINLENSINITTTKINTITTKKPTLKKPLITIASAEVFPASMFLPNSNDALPSSSTTVKVVPVKNETSIPNNLESSSPIISSMQNPIDDVAESIPQYYQDNVYYSKSQPGYIIPLVITLFAVPLLGFVGYQAIRRGKEAWRNRHYRRMDFLIDGMYND